MDFLPRTILFPRLINPKLISKDMSKEEAKDALIELLYSQVVDLTMMSKIELGDDVIAEINKLQSIIKENE